MKKEIFANEINFNGISCVELCAGGYYALVAPELGSNVIRLRDTNNNIEVLRFFDDNTLETYKESPEVYGFPTMYLPNRVDRGVLKTSDAVYNFPLNEGEPYFNYLHGFMHKRKHTLTKIQIENDSAIVKTEFIYDENDEMFKYFPVKFKAEFTYILAENGLEQYLTMTNLSDKMMPMGIGSHTAIKAPFVDGGDVNDIRLQMAIGERCEFTKRWMPTEKLLPLTEYDNRYLDGEVNPVTKIIDNEMYVAELLKLDGDYFHGAVAEDTASGKKVCYETGDEYKFWIVWNEWANKGYFCPEPMTWMINAPNLSLPADVSGYRELSPNESFTAYQHIFTKA